jgi:hypothetical protein
MVRKPPVTLFSLVLTPLVFIGYFVFASAFMLKIRYRPLYHLKVLTSVSHLLPVWLLRPEYSRFITPEL